VSKNDDWLFAISKRLLANIYNIKILKARSPRRRKLHLGYSGKIKRKKYPYPDSIIMDDADFDFDNQFYLFESYQNRGNSVFGNARSGYNFDEILFHSPDWIAERIRQLVTESRISGQSLDILHAIHDALLWEVTDFRWKIIIKSTISGRPKPLDEVNAVVRSRESIFFDLVNLLTELLGKKEAAVAMVVEKFGVSRANLFAMMANAKLTNQPKKPESSNRE
jgi:ribosomal 50S subunit-associated protein YjgA (DUF615 family)